MKARNRLRRCLLTVLALGAMLTAGIALGDTHYWNGDGDGVSWSDPDNWDLDAVPATTSDGESADDVVVDGLYAVYIDATVQAIHSLTIDGDALVVLESGYTLYTQGLTITDGGLELENISGVGANVTWSKANRGILSVDADGYIRGTGVIRTQASSVIKFMSTRSSDFDMTDITLRIDYGENLWVCSQDNGRDSYSDWESNFAIGKLIIDDYRYTTGLFEADGTTGGDANALYCYELVFVGAWDDSDGAALDLQGTNVYVRDQITWFDDSYTDTAGQLTVATAYDNLDVTTSLLDDDTPQGAAYIGIPPNTAPSVEAGSGSTIMMPSYAVLDATVTDDGLPGTGLSYSWTKYSGPGEVTFTDDTVCDTTATFSVDGTYVLELAASDGDLSASDTVTIVVEAHVRGTHHWNGAGDGVSWNDPDNWLEDAVPSTTSTGDEADDVEINGSYDVRVTQDVSSVRYVTINGDATLTVDPAVTLTVQQFDIINGGLILDYDEYDDSAIHWGKANRGHFYVESAGYVAGCGEIYTLASSAGVRIKSTRSTDFDMTYITLRIGYQEALWVCSEDLGGADAAEWAASNFAIGKIVFNDRRYSHIAAQADGTAGDGTNAIYCMELQFGGDVDESASLDINSMNLYVLDKVTWGNGTYTDTDGELTVATGFTNTDFTTAIWDDNATQGKAYLGVIVNQAPVVDAGADDMIAVVQSAALDATVTDDGLPGSGLSYAWSKISGPGTVTFADDTACDTTASFSTDGEYVLQLQASDGDLSASDTVTITVSTYATGTRYWSGDGDGSSWSDPDNWYADTVPYTTSDGEGADNVIIQGNVVVHVDSTVDAIHYLTINGNARVVIDSGVTLNLQQIDIIDGGLELQEVSGTGANIEWSKANRGHLYVESDGYICGAGQIWTLASSSGVQFRSTRATDFDMTAITLRVGYQEQLRFCSDDDGRVDNSAWVDNFAIGKLYFSDRRYNHTASQGDGSAGDGTNAIYCLELQFAGDVDESARLDINSMNLYVRDKVTWGDGSYTDTAGALTVATAFNINDFTTAVWDDNASQGSAYVSTSSYNAAPVADAGSDQSATDSDDNGSESITLDGTNSYDSDGSIVSYVWTEGQSQLATGANPTVSLAVGTHTITLTVTDDDSDTDTDTVVVTVNAAAGTEPLPLTNRQSGISISLSGANGSDWAVEQLYHDMAVGDQLLFVKSSVNFSLAHNANNTIMKRDSIAWSTWTADGPDGIPDTGDEGDIHYKIDRDMQSHRYNSSAAIPSYAPEFSSAFNFNTLTYDGSLDVLGTTGDNGGAYGASPSSTTARFGYGQSDAFGNEWHTLTYWDDDEPVYASIPESSHRQGASDGHWVYICVNPVTPVIQFAAPEGEQFYTTPIKTYHIPKTWDQTTYLTDGVAISFINLTDANPVYYRVDGGTWTQYTAPLTADAIFANDDTAISLEYRCGTTGAVAERTIVMNPSTPAPGETHGMLMWADAAEKAECVTKVAGTQPFAYSYDILCGDYFQNLTTVYTDVRGGWRSGAGMASTAMSNAFPVAIDGLTTRINNARMAKERLLRMARLEPVGFENGVSNATPAKDYLNELGQTIQQFADAGVAYDFLAADFRVGDHTDGMTPIEELKIRDGLAEVAKSILQFRDNWSYVPGSGDTHWAHGYELAVGAIALAMPTYATPYFGVSGGDLTSTNSYVDGNGYYYNPFPNIGLTWYECVADPEIACDGYPDNKAPMRSEFQITDEGYWSGPNYLVGDGNRYYTGPISSRLVDIKSGGLANAENRVELIEMGGYESPFVGRIQALTLMRKIAGDDAQQQCVQTYMRRRLVGGVVPLSWDATNLKYLVDEPRVNASLISFNNNFDWAGQSSAVTHVSDFLTYVNRYYGYETGTYPDYISDARKSLQDVYVLACCADPDDINTPVGDANHAPIIKPMFKYVVEPGDTIEKVVLAVDLDDDSISYSLSNLPSGASWNSTTRTITWTPTSNDLGVHVVSVAVSDGSVTTTRKFPMIVMTDPGSGPVPSAPSSVSVSLNDDDASISWSAPTGVTVDSYIIYVDGNIYDVVDSTTTSYTVYDLPAGSHTRLYVSLLDSDGDESYAVEASGSYVSVAAD